MWYNRAQRCHRVHLESDTFSAPPEAAGGFLRWLYSLGAAQFVPGLVIFHWLLLQSHRLQVRRVDVLQNRANSTTWSEINQRGSQRAECCTNTDICEVLSASKGSLVPCCDQELTKS